MNVIKWQSNFFQVPITTSTLYYALLSWMMTFYIALCKIKLSLQLQLSNSVPVSCIMVFRIVLCFSMLNYGKVIYAYIISYGTQCTKFGRHSLNMSHD